MTTRRLIGLGAGAGDKGRRGFATLAQGRTPCPRGWQGGFPCAVSPWRPERKQTKRRKAKCRARRCFCKSDTAERHRPPRHSGALKKGAPVLGNAQTQLWGGVWLALWQTHSQALLSLSCCTRGLGEANGLVGGYGACPQWHWDLNLGLLDSRSPCPGTHCLAFSGPGLGSWLSRKPRPPVGGTRSRLLLQRKKKPGAQLGVGQAWGRVL